MLIDSASWLVAVAVLASGSIGLGLAGVGAHHGLVGLPAVWLFGLLANWAHDVLRWRFRRSKETRPGWSAALWRVVFGSTTSTARALIVPVIGYAWAHLTTSLPRGLAWSVPVLVTGALVWWVWRLERRWPRTLTEAKEAAKETARSLRRFRPRLTAWMVLTPLWAPPVVSVQELLRETPEWGDWRPDVGSFQWVDPVEPGVRNAFTSVRGLMLAAQEDVPNDVFLVRVALTHDGNPARIRGAYDLSDTSAVEESNLVVWQRWAVWFIRHGNAVQSVEIADLRGEERGRGEGWDAVARVQRAITNRQHTGQWQGVGRSSLRLDEPATDVTAEFDASVLDVGLPDRRVSLDLGRVPTQETLGEGIEFSALPPPSPGSLVTWGVDRLRALPWIGSGGMQRVKAWAFKASEQLKEIEQEIVGIDADAVIAEELGDVLKSLPLVRSSEIPGWPPEPIAPLLSPSLAGEGQWVSLAEDVIVSGPPGVGSPFVFTFVRTDRKRAFIQTSITLWDPRRVELHVVAGTEEPKSMTGQLGSGLIPRDPDVLEHLVAAFNGAFQAVHGEFGMMEQGRVQLPPKPYAATVATFPDASAGFGTWPPDTPIPSEMRAYRQNLTPLVVDDAENPYQRSWWGGVPEGWTEETRTVRSGMCLTREGFIAYFYSPGIDPRGLAQAMLQTRCSYGIHLDMNAGHTGFEFYRVAPAGTLPPLDRPLDRLWEARGVVSGTGSGAPSGAISAQSYEFSSRLMVRKMPLMNFPRYIHLTSRDFFYLTRRALLPDAALSPIVEGESADGHWRVDGIDDNAWPHAVAVTGLHATGERNEKRFFLITRLDPKQLTLVAEPVRASLGLVVPASEAPQQLWFTPQGFRITTRAPVDGARLVGHGAEIATETTRGAVCIDRAGLATLVEQDGRDAPSPRALARVLERIDCRERLFLDRPARAAFHAEARAVAAKDDPPHVRDAPPTKTWFVRQPLLGARRMFEQTPILPPKDWAIPQARRVPYTGRPGASEATPAASTESTEPTEPTESTGPNE